ncbi:MAG: DNA polymerase III subunit alpha, partial [Actinobacteria bacterium]|nr:DNA polymerase III subunit alpha [Actinomycetota bacterium]
VDIKRAEAIGQFDLFGGLEAQGDSALVAQAEISLGEWEKSVLLAHEREMLGLYVSDHPLHGAERALAQLTDRSIAALLNDERADSTVATIGGLITSVQRKTTKQGSSWAIITLEDLEGSVEIMVFPQTYLPVSTSLVEDVVVVVRGRVDRSDDDGVRVVALDVTLPDLSEAASGPMRLTMPATRCIPPLVDKLKEVLGGHPGTTEVHLHLTGGVSTTVLRLDDKLRVTPSSSLYGDLKALLGPTCLN